MIGYLWLTGGSYTSICNQTGHSIATITDYLGHYRQLVAGSLDKDDCVIGGPGIIVEIDESKFGNRKYNRGHRVEGVWVVGGVERTKKRAMFVEVVSDRTAETLCRAFVDVCSSVTIDGRQSSQVLLPSVAFLVRDAAVPWVVGLSQWALGS